MALRPDYDILGHPLDRWLDFHTRRFSGEQSYGLAGFACHFGLGLFMPA